MERLPEFISNHLFLVSLLISLLMLLIWNLYGGVLSGVKQIIPAELTRLINHEKAIVVDVRSVEDYKNSHILNALNIPDAELEDRKKELDKYTKQPVIFYCGSGAVSARMARTFLSQGFEQVFCLKGGLPSWTGANLPLSKQT
jgi:rhodanese-related sulfurtransferase